MSEHTAESDAPVEVVRAMVHLAEMFGHTLPWANLLAACAGIADADRLRWAVEDLVNEGAIEVTPKGLRFLLTEPPTRPLPPAERVCPNEHRRGSCPCGETHDYGEFL